MRKSLGFVVLFGILALMGCGGHGKNSSSSPTSPSSNSDPLDQMMVNDIQLPHADNKIADFVYGNLNGALASPIDANGANITLRDYSWGVVKSWIAGYGNTVVSNHPGTIIRDVLVNGKIDHSIRIEPYGWKTPDDFRYFVFDPGHQKTFQLLPSGRYKAVQVGSEWHIQGSLPPVNAATTASVAYTAEGDTILRPTEAQINAVAPARLVRVETFDGRLLCDGEDACRSRRDR